MYNAKGGNERDPELARWRCKGSTWIQWPGPHKEWYALPGPMYFELGYIVSKYNKELSRLAIAFDRSNAQLTELEAAMESAFWARHMQRAAGFASVCLFLVFAVSAFVLAGLILL